MAARPDAFSFIILVEADGEAIISAIERDMIFLGNTLHPKGFNLREGGLLSYRWSEEARARQRGKKMHPDTLAKLRASHLGIKQSPETIAKRAAKLRGRTQARDVVEARRQKMIGRPVSDEQKARLRALQLGKKHSADTRAKQSMSIRASAAFAKSREAMRGRKHSPETREKMRASHGTSESKAKSAAAKLGNKASVATREKMSASQQRRIQVAKAALQPSKPCTRCGDVLPSTTEFFSPDKRALTGLYPACKRCRRAAWLLRHQKRHD